MKIATKIKEGFTLVEVVVVLLLLLLLYKIVQISRLQNEEDVDNFDLLITRNNDNERADLPESE